MPIMSDLIVELDPGVHFLQNERRRVIGEMFLQRTQSKLPFYVQRGLASHWLLRHVMMVCDGYIIYNDHTIYMQ